MRVRFGLVGAKIVRIGRVRLKTAASQIDYLDFWKKLKKIFVDQ